MLNTLPNNYKLNARYTILHQIGQGGFGITYKAIDSLTDQYVCIKELFISGHNFRESSYRVTSQTNTEQFNFTYFKHKFLEEGKRLAQFNHPNIVRVIDFFQDYNTAYLIMEFIEGESLKHFVERHKRLNQKQALFLCEQLLSAVKDLHNKGLLHRDIKPDNILIKSNKELVLIDFGLAKAYDQYNDMTSTLVILSHGYAPPEQYSKEGKKGPYTDIYAIGATIYFLLTGIRPTQSTDRHFEKLKSISTYNPEIDQKIILAVEKCMELIPTKRFQTVQELSNSMFQVDFSSKKDVTALHVSNNNLLKPSFKIATTFLFLLVIIYELFFNKSVSINYLSIIILLIVLSLLWLFFSRLWKNK